MLGYLVGRVLWTVPILFAVSIVVFAMIHLIPGDPIAAITADTYLDREAQEQLRHELGLDKPLHEQYVTYVSKVIRGDFGRSVRSNIPVRDLIASQLPRTVELAIPAVLLASSAGLLLGVISAVNFRRWPDRFGRLVSLTGIAMPSFWAGMLLILLFSVTLKALPIGGQGTLAHLIMPSLALGLPMAAVITRTLRAGLLDVLGAEYVRTARAKGIGEKVVLYRHAMRNALLPTITVVGLQIGFLLSGTIVVETVFSRQGIGRLTVIGVLNRDFPVVQGTVLASAVIYLLVNLIVDVLYWYVDPRTRR